MLTFTLTVAVVVLAGWAVIKYGPEGWRTKIFNAVSLAVPGLAATLDQLGMVDWSRFISKQHVAYGLAVAIPIMGIWLRIVTKPRA